MVTSIEVYHRDEVLLKRKSFMEFPCGTVGWGSSTVTAVAWVAVVAQIGSPARELAHAGAAKKIKIKISSKLTNSHIYRDGNSPCSYQAE